MRSQPLIKFTINKYERYKRLKALGELNSQAHLRVLGSQLSPHFVFNALNNLRFMLLSDPDRAREMALNIVDIIKEVETLTKDTHILLSDELRTTKKYLQLIQVHLSDTFLISIYISVLVEDVEYQSVRVLPLVLQLLCKNAVKHCLNSRNFGFLKVRVRITENWVFYSVVNSPADEKYEKLSTNNESYPSLLPVGLNNIKSRLELGYNDNYKFRLLKGNVIKVIIAFPRQG